MREATIEKCEKCGESVRRNQNFCPSCGQSLKAQRESAIAEEKVAQKGPKVKSVSIGLSDTTLEWLNDATFAEEISNAKRCRSRSAIISLALDEFKRRHVIKKDLKFHYVEVAEEVGEEERDLENWEPGESYN